MSQLLSLLLLLWGASALANSPAPAFSAGPKPHPTADQLNLSGASHFAFNSAHSAQWPNHLTQFFAGSLRVDPRRLYVWAIGGGKSGDLVFGVRLDGHELGVLKVFRQPQGANEELKLTQRLVQANLSRFRPAKNKGVISSVTIDGLPASAAFIEKVPGKTIERWIQKTPSAGAAREQHLQALERAVSSAAESYLELHEKMATGQLVTASHKQSEVNLILSKVAAARASGHGAWQWWNQLENRLRNDLAPKYLSAALPATVYHGDAHVGNIMIDDQMNARPIDLSSMKWAYDAYGQGKQTGAVDVGQFLARLHEKSEGILSSSEVDRLQRAFTTSYFRQSKVSQADMKAAMILYGVETQLSRLQYGIGNPQGAIAAIDKLLSP